MAAPAQRLGSYTNGTYEQTPPMPGGYAPTYECRVILPDGRMLVIGGEYQGESTPAESATGAVYDPVTNSWKTVPPPPNTTHLGDIACSLMPNGKVLISNQFAGRVNGRVTLDLLDPSTMTWQVLHPVKADPLTEEGWTLLPEILADGYRREIIIPVKFIVDGELRSKQEDETSSSD